MNSFRRSLPTRLFLLATALATPCRADTDCGGLIDITKDTGLSFVSIVCVEDVSSHIITSLTVTLNWNLEVQDDTPDLFITPLFSDVTIGNVTIIINEPYPIKGLRVTIRESFPNKFISLGSFTHSGLVVAQDFLIDGPIVGSIDANRIHVIRVAGDINGNITSGGSTVIPGSIDTVQSNLGNILGDITATAQCDNVLAKLGSIGDPLGDPISIQARLIGQIEAQDVNAKIESRDSLGSFYQFGRLITSVGDFKGSLRALHLEPLGGTLGSEAFLDITGDLDADVRFEFDVRGLGPTGLPTIPGQRAIRIGGTIKKDRTLTIGDELKPDESTDQTRRGGIVIGDVEGLEGQIIINARYPSNNQSGNDPSAYPTWANAIEIGSVSLDPTNDPTNQTFPPVGASNEFYGAYFEPSDTFGGGAIGVVPYRLYASDCFPKHHDDWVVPSGETHLLNSQFNGTIPDGSGGHLAKIPVAMRFYGPVRTEVASPTAPLAMWLYLHGDQWADVTGLVDIDLKRGSDPGSSREVVVSHKNGYSELAPGYYAIVAITDPEASERLYCDKTLHETPPSVAANIAGISQYNFRLFADCNKDGVEDTGTGSCGGTCIADVNNGTGTGQPDGGVTIDDLIDYYALSLQRRVCRGRCRRRQRNRHTRRWRDDRRPPLLPTTLQRWVLIAHVDDDRGVAPKPNERSRCHAVTSPSPPRRTPRPRGRG